MYITKQGFERLQQEWYQLWYITRPEITKSVSAAAALGDRSENAEYIYGKKQLREIDRRVRFLTKRMQELKVVDRLPENLDRIYFGAWVELMDENDDIRWVRIVGTDEFDMSPHYISYKAPLAHALLGKQEGDQVTLMIEGCKKYYEIIGIFYNMLGDLPPSLINDEPLVKLQIQI